MPTGFCEDPQNKLSDGHSTELDYFDICHHMVLTEGNETREQHSESGLTWDILFIREENLVRKQP